MKLSHAAKQTWRKSSYSNGTSACLEAVLWRKSSRSGSNGGDCLEAAYVGTTVAIRDSKLNTTSDFPILTIPTADWTALLATVSA